MASKRILRIVRRDETTMDLNIVGASLHDQDHPVAMKIERTRGDDVILEFNPSIIGEFVDVESIHIVRQKAKRLIRFRRSKGGNVDLNIESAISYGIEHPVALRLDRTTGNNVAIAFSPHIIGQLADIDRIDMVRMEVEEKREDKKQ